MPRRAIVHYHDGIRIASISDGGHGAIGYVVRDVDTVEHARRAVLGWLARRCGGSWHEHYTDPRTCTAETGAYAWRLRGDLWAPAVPCIAPVEPGAPGWFLACYLLSPHW